MNARALILAGCLVTFGLAACNETNDDVDPVDTTTVVDTLPKADSMSMVPDSSADTSLRVMQQVDTVITTTDTTVKEGKEVPVGKKSTSGSSSSKSSGSSSSSGTGAAVDRRGSSSSGTEAESRRDGSSGSGTEAESRRGTSSGEGGSAAERRR